MASATQFHDAEKYANYLQTFSGRLRGDLAWENLRGFLSEAPRQRRALDLGGGTGVMSARLARNGFEVVLLDGAEEMLKIAREKLSTEEWRSRVTVLQGDAAQLLELFAPQSFDVVICHNVLEFVEEPQEVVRGIAAVMRAGGVFSLLVRNRMGEILKAAIKSRDANEALQLFAAATAVDSLYGKPIRFFNNSDLEQMLEQAGLAAVGRYGVRVFSDYRTHEEADSETDSETYRRIFETEIRLGARPEFAAVARYLQKIARRSHDAAGAEN